MAMSRRTKLIVIGLVAALGVAAQPMILGSQVDQCKPSFTDAVAARGILWVANGASSPGVEWINLEAEDDAPDQTPDPGLPAWLDLPIVPESAAERRVGTVALGWPVRWSFCQWVATDTEHFFPPIAENEEPCQSLRRAVRDWGQSADGASVRSWVGMTGVVVCWLTIAAPMVLVVLATRQSAGKSGSAP
ncbi:MAG: hypothetical protein FJ270_01630 [Planctomycetes bacterium]|nr:hypothetical protein [Planctomycetota bacterium]